LNPATNVQAAHPVIPTSVFRTQGNKLEMLVPINRR